MGLMDPSGGLSGGKLALANATPGDVIAGKTFYSGNKELKTGTLVERGSIIDSISSGSEPGLNDIYVRFPPGAYRTNASSGYPEIKVPKLQVTPFVWDRDRYLYFYSFFQGGYGEGPIAQHAATLIGVGDGHTPGFLAHACSMFNGNSNVCNAGMISVAPNDNTGVTKLTALTNIRNIFTNTPYYTGNVFTLGGGVPACFCLL